MQSRKPTLGDWLFLAKNFEMAPEDLQKACPSLAVLQCPDGERIVREGDSGVDMYIVGKGTVAVRRNTFLFFSKEVAQLGPGDFFGEIGFFIQIKRTATVHALGAAEVYRVLSTEMQGLLEHHPGLKRHLSDLASDRLRRTTQGVA